MSMFIFTNIYSFKSKYYRMWDANKQTFFCAAPLRPRKLHAFLKLARAARKKNYCLVLCVPCIPAPIFFSTLQHVSSPFGDLLSMDSNCLG